MEERIELRLSIERGAVVAAAVRSSRRTDASRVLNGKPIDAALDVLPLLFPLCGRAQQLAATRALETGSALTLPDAHGHARRALLLAEVIESHGRSLWIDAAEVLAVEPEIARFAALHQASAQLARALYPDRDAHRAGHLRAERDEIDRQVGAMKALLTDELPPPSADGVAALTRWMARDGAFGARLLAEVSRRGWTSIAASASLADDISVADVRRGLDADPTVFAAYPTVRQRAAEVGPLARRRHHDEVQPVVAAFGPGLLARHWARLIDLREALRRLEEVTARLESCAPAERRWLSAGDGLGSAPTARGPLFHRVRWADGRVLAWDRVAPTEWTFHPDGVATHAPVGWPAAEAADMARHHVLGLDPCVPFDVAVVDASAA